MMKRFLILLLFIPALCGIAESAQMDKTILSVKKDIERETAKLNDLRQKISRERLPLTNKIRALEKETVSLRKKAYALKGAVWQKETGFAQLKEEANFLREEIEFCSSILLEFRRDMSKRMGMAEEQRFSARLKEIDAKLDSENTADSLRAMRPLLTLLARRNRETLGGFTFNGDCLDKDGLVHWGSFVLAGPLTYFASERKGLAGMVGVKMGKTTASVIAQVKPALIHKLAEGKRVIVPLDFTLGEAVKVEGAKKGWLTHIKAGGIIMVPILGLGLVCVIIAIWKFLSLSRLKTDVEPTLSEILDLVQKNKIPEAEKRARSLGLPVGPVFLEGVHHHKASREHIEEIMHEEILSQIPFLERHLSLLAVTAAAAPLLGLLGTVTGMIHTFNLVTIFGTGKTSLLSGGISEALVTTEYGLIVAIPALLIHAYLSRRVRKNIHTLEQTAVAFINGLKIKKQVVGDRT